MTHTFSPFSLPALLTAALLLSGAALGQAGAQGMAPNLAANTVTVQQGDTAYSLARRAGLSVEAFLALNNLSSPDLKVGQVLMVSSMPPHTVQAGETLYGLAKKYGVTVDAIKAANTLPEDAVIAVGQMLKIPAPSAAPQTVQVVAASVQTVPNTAPVVQVTAAQVTVSPVGQPAAVNVETSDTMPLLSGNWRDNAMSMIGTPYVYGGTSRRGLDCSGFVLQVFTPLGVKLPRVSADQARSGVPVAVNNLQPGDLLFFDTVGGGKVTHVGIYLGNDSFINANSYRGQVAIDRLLSDKYWAPRYISARRVLPDTVAMSRP